MEDSDSREGFGNFGWLGRSDDYAGSRNQGPMDVRNMIDGDASTGADVTRTGEAPSCKRDTIWSSLAHNFFRDTGLHQ